MIEGFDPGHRPYGGDSRVVEVVSGARRHPYPLDPPPGTTARASWGGQGPGDAAAAATPWGFGDDPQTKRKKRIARYKAYGAEGRVKAALRRGIRWIRDKCSHAARRL